MAGSLIKIDEEIVTSAVASVTLTGIDSTYDVYKVVNSNVAHTHTSTNQINIRLTSSGTPVTSSSYSRAGKELVSNASFNNKFYTSGTAMNADSVGTATTDVMNQNIYCFNFNNASEYSFITYEGTSSISSIVYGIQGGFSLNVVGANDGLQFYMLNGNIDTGSTFTLYGLKK